MSEHVTMARRPFAMVSHDFITESIKQIGPSAACVYLYLVKCAGSEDSCFPSSQHMADALGMSEKTVRTAIQALKDAKLVTVVPRIRENGSRTSNLIVIHDPVNFTDTPPVKFTPPPLQNLPGHKKIESNKRDILPNPRKKHEYTPAFEAFWSRTWKVGSKPKAQDSWSALTDEERQDIDAVLDRWTTYYAGPDTWQKHVVTWLNERLWESSVPRRVSPNGHRPQLADRVFIDERGNAR